MKKLIAPLLLFSVAAFPQALSPSGYNAFSTGSLTAAGATCAVTNACVSVHLANTITQVSAVLSGTFTATIVVEKSADNGVTWVNVDTLSAAGTTTYVASAFTDFRVRCSAYTSGTALAVLNAGGAATSTSSSSSSSTSPSVATLPSGLTAEYRILPTETVSTLVDYSVNGNTGQATVGTAPTIIAGTGGLNCTGNGAVKIPSALNTALTIFMVVSYQASSNANTFNAPILGNATGPGPAIGMLLSTSVTAGVVDSIPGGSRANSYPNTINATTNSYDVIQGTESIALTMGGTDKFFVNGLPGDPSGFTQPSSNSAGIQSSGQFQICGGAAGTGAGAQSYFTGKIYYLATWSRALSAQEIAQVHAYAANLLAQRAIFINPIGLNTSTTNLALFDGDSITVGLNLTTPFPNAITLNGTWNIANQAKSSKQVVANGLIELPTAIDPMLAGSAGASLDVLWLGTNDITNTGGVQTPATTFAGLRSYCAGRKVLGWKCAVATMISRVASAGCPSANCDLGKNQLNVLLRQHWAEFSDALIDIAADPNMGADGANANTTFFQGDATHPTQNAAINELAPIFQRGINRLYGNRDFNSAATYTVAALAATATTAGSEATNTVTLTFGATPANCLVNNQIVVAGTTPAGYSGTYNILTRSGTQVTYFAPTASMGVITVQGTGACPQQQDADVYTILGGSATTPAFNMQSCQGYTGQNLYFKQTNTTSNWVLTPFVSAETIDGATTLSMPTSTSGNNSIVVLQAQLVSAAAGGCTWKRLQ